MKINNKGEIATILTVVTLGLMLVGTVVGTKLAGQGPREQSEARGFGELQTYGTLDNCKWNTAGELCKDSGDKGRCICEKLGTGICTPVGGSCEKNPWDSTWGCWSTDKLDKCNNPGAPPQPPAGGGQPQPPAGGGGGQQAANCTLSDQKNDPGNCCSTCIASKRPDLRPFFNSNGWSACNDTQIVNNWCNGILANIPTESPTYGAKDDCKKIREGDCKAECSKDQSTCQATGGTTGGAATSGTPAPTTPPGGVPGSPGGSVGGPAAPVPTPDFGSQTTYGSFIIVSKDDSKIYTTASYPFDDTPSSVKVEIEKPLGVLNLVSASSLVVSPAPSDTSSLTEPDNNVSIGDITATYLYRLKNRIVSSVDNKVGLSPVNGNIKVTKSDATVVNFPQEIKLCFPHSLNKFPITEKTAIPTITLDNLTNKCNERGQSTVLNINIDQDIAPIPEPMGFKYTINPVGFSYNYKVKIFFMKFYNMDDYSQLDIFLKRGNNNIKINSTDGVQLDRATQFFTGPINPPQDDTTDRTFKVSYRAEMYQGDVQKASCKTNDNIYFFEHTAKLLKRHNINQSNDMGNFEITYIDDTNCKFGKGTAVDTLSGSSNEIFRKAMERWVTGEIGVLEMSGFVNQLTRYPGLQISFCDPRKGECNPTF